MYWYIIKMKGSREFEFLDDWIKVLQLNFFSDRDSTPYSGPDFEKKWNASHVVVTCMYGTIFLCTVYIISVWNTHQSLPCPLLRSTVVTFYWVCNGHKNECVCFRHHGPLYNLVKEQKLLISMNYPLLSNNNNELHLQGIYRHAKDKSQSS